MPPNWNKFGRPDCVMDANDIAELLPHRFPKLLVDRVTELEPGVQIVAYKNITANEPQMPGHYPEMMVEPGSEMIEATSQVVALMFLTRDLAAPATPALASVNVKFRGRVIPGDKLTITAEFDRQKMGLYFSKVTGTVDGEVVFEGTISGADFDQNDEHSTK